MRPNIGCAVAMFIGALVPAAPPVDVTNNVSGHVRTGEAPLSVTTRSRL
jgi:hypothetical protein